MKTKMILTCVVCCLIFVPATFAHPGHDHHTHGSNSRTWTDDTGFFQMQGTFVMARDGKVQVRKPDDTLTTLPIERLSEKDQAWIKNRMAELDRLNTHIPQLVVAQLDPQRAGSKPDGRDAPPILNHFEPFEDTLKFRWDKAFFYVESNGMPDHPMMTGITAWQQQVPLPQPYTGNNAWRIPLHPVPAKKPMSAKTNFFRGAIALAVNGVPIFNPIKNDGRTDTLLAGELDKWGGHCGRADDYHYHIAPVHLETKVGKGRPVAYALDGFPIYGYQDPKADDFAPLDWLNGHKDSKGNYHYHATKTYPYLNGGFYGEVTERNGQVDPQPRAQGVRPSLPGLKGAKITGFENPKPGSYVVRYEVFGDKRSVEYTVAENGSATFNFVSSDGTKTENYTPRQGGGDGRRNAERPTGNEPKGNRGHGGGRRGGRPGQAGGPRGPQPGDGPRQPWILVHADEIDLDKDKIITRDEIVGEATKAFAGYDANNDGKLTPDELGARGGSRSAMGGFLKGHSKEIDRDGDGILTRAEAVGNAERMFAKMDANGDGKITPEEKEASRRK